MLNYEEFLLSRLVDPLGSLYQMIKGLIIKQLAFKFLQEVEKKTKLRVLITSGAEEITKHSPDSYHYKGRAIDFVLLNTKFEVTYSKELSKIVENIANEYNLFCLDEWKHPTLYTTGGHWHIHYVGIAKPRKERRE